MSCDKLAFVPPITCLDCEHSSSGLKFNISYSGNPSMVHGPSNLSEMFLPCAPITPCTFTIKALVIFFILLFCTCLTQKPQEGRYSLLHLQSISTIASA